MSFPRRFAIASLVWATVLGGPAPSSAEEVRVRGTVGASGAHGADGDPAGLPGSPGTDGGAATAIASAPGEDQVAEAFGAPGGSGGGGGDGPNPDGDGGDGGDGGRGGAARSETTGAGASFVRSRAVAGNGGYGGAGGRGWPSGDGIHGTQGAGGAGGDAIANALLETDIPGVAKGLADARGGDAAFSGRAADGGDAQASVSVTNLGGGVDLHGTEGAQAWAGHGHFGSGGGSGGHAIAESTGFGAGFVIVESAAHAGKGLGAPGGDATARAHATSTGDGVYAQVHAAPGSGSPPGTLTAEASGISTGGGDVTVFARGGGRVLRDAVSGSTSGHLTLRQHLTARESPDGTPALTSLQAHNPGGGDLSVVVSGRSDHSGPITVEHVDARAEGFVEVEVKAEAARSGLHGSDARVLSALGVGLAAAPVRVDAEAIGSEGSRSAFGPSETHTGGDAEVRAFGAGWGEVEVVATARGGDARGDLHDPAGQAGGGLAHAAAAGTSGTARAVAVSGKGMEPHFWVEAQGGAVSQVAAQAAFATAFAEAPADLDLDAVVFASGAPAAEDIARARAGNRSLDRFFGSARARMQLLARWKVAGSGVPEVPTLLSTQLRLYWYGDRPERLPLLGFYDIDALGNGFKELLVRIEAPGTDFLPETLIFSTPKEVAKELENALIRIGKRTESIAFVELHFQVILDPDDAFAMSWGFASEVAQEEPSAELVNLELRGEDTIRLDLKSSTTGTLRSTTHSTAASASIGGGGYLRYRSQDAQGLEFTLDGDIDERDKPSLRLLGDLGELEDVIASRIAALFPEFGGIERLDIPREGLKTKVSGRVVEGGMALILALSVPFDGTTSDGALFSGRLTLKSRLSSAPRCLACGTIYAGVGSGKTSVRGCDSGPRRGPATLSIQAVGPVETEAGLLYADSTGPVMIGRFVQDGKRASCSFSDEAVAARLAFEAESLCGEPVAGVSVKQAKCAVSPTSDGRMRFSLSLQGEAETGQGTRRVSTSVRGKLLEVPAR